MNGPDRQLQLPADAALLLQHHFDTIDGKTKPISIRAQVRDLRGTIDRRVVPDDLLIREVERHAVERGYSVVFDAHVTAESDRLR